MNFSLSDILIVILIFQLLFISVFLYTHSKGKKVSNYLLGTFFLSVCLNIIDSFLLLKRVYFSYPMVATWGSCLPLLFGPLLYLYSQSVLYKGFSFSFRKWVHFIPFIVCFLFTEINYLLIPENLKLKLLEDIIERKVPGYLYWSTAIIFIQFSLYIIASFRLIKQFKKIAGDQFSDQQRVNISWLSSTIIFFSCCMVIAALNGFTSLTPWANYFYFIFFIIILLLFVFINRVLMRALQKPELFAVMNEEDNPVKNPLKYPGSNLTAGDSKRLVEQLQQHMKTRKPYLEPELTLEQLATQLSIRPKILSQVINESLNQNFFDFVNRYRIEDAKQLLTNPEDKKITVLEVLYEVGFNSKSSFNTLFKKHTGLTPSEFKRKNLK